MNKFEAQGCPGGVNGCNFQSNVRDDATVTIIAPIVRKAVKNKGMLFVCDLTLDWSDTIYCYKTAVIKKAADDDREKARLAKEKAAKDGK